MTPNGPVTFTFDQESVTTLKITTDDGEDAARRVADALQAISVQATFDELDCNEDIPAGTIIDPTCVAPRGHAYLVYAVDAHGKDVKVRGEPPIPEPVSGDMRRELAARLAGWQVATGSPSADAEHQAAAALATTVAALLQPR